jgi:hypothetical protein
MSQIDTGMLDFNVTNNGGQQKDGQIELKGTLNNDGTITGATLTYAKDNNPTNNQTITVTFTGTAAPYSGTCSIANGQPLNVPGQGSYKGGSFTYNATATPPLAGTFTKDAIAGTPGDLSWDATDTGKSIAAQSAAY